jgi:hypothetical protein
MPAKAASSTPQRFGSVLNACDYWVPAFAGTTVCFALKSVNYISQVDAGRQMTHRPASFAQGDYLSGEIGIVTSPVMNFVGPAADGMMSKSKISVGSHSVAQAFGISTTPEMWPWHGAVPRIE